MRHAVGILLGWVLVSSLGLGVIVLCYGWPRTSLPVEVLKQPRTSFRDEALRAIFESRHLARARSPLLIILGASVAQEAFTPSALQPHVSGQRVNNLAVGAANITEMEQTFDLVLKFAPHRILQESTLVLAVSYPGFVTDQRRWTHPDFVSQSLVARGLVISDIAREAIRSPLLLDPRNLVFKLTPGPLLNVVQQRLAILLPLVKLLPLNLADPLLKWPGWRFNPLSFVNKAAQSDLPPAPKPSKVYTPREQMDWLTDYMGRADRVLPPEQFLFLESLIARARRAGLKVVVVNLPLPSWHIAEGPFYQQYRKRIADMMEGLSGDQGVRFVDMIASIPDENFRDSVHPTPETVVEWATILGEKLREQ